MSRKVGSIEVIYCKKSGKTPKDCTYCTALGGECSFKMPQNENKKQLNSFISKIQKRYRKKDIFLIDCECQWKQDAISNTLQLIKKTNRVHVNPSRKGGGEYHEDYHLWKREKSYQAS